MKQIYPMHGHWQGFGIGVLLLVLGLFFFAQDLGLIQSEISIWPILLIAIGGYWTIAGILKNTKH